MVFGRVETIETELPKVARHSIAYPINIGMNPARNGASRGTELVMVKTKA